MTNKDKKIIALLAAIIYIAFIIFVLVFPGLKEIRFVQVLTGLLTALFVAVELFILVPAPPIANLPIAVVSAAAFYLVIVPQIFDAITETKAVSGTIYYKDTTHAVPGVLIRIPNTDQSTTTDENGDFKLIGVAKNIKTLKAKYAGRDTDIDLNDSGKYFIEKSKIEIEKTDIKALDSSVWKEVTDNQCAQYKGTNDAVQLFILKKEQIQRVNDFQNLIIQVRLKGEGEIVHAEAFEPLPETVTRQQEGDPSKTRKWRIPVENDKVNLEFAFCVGTKRNAQSVTANDWEVGFWFQKEK